MSDEYDLTFASGVFLISANQSKKGISAAHGIAIGRAFLVDRRRLKVPKRKVESDEVESEVERFRRALETSDRQFERIKKKIAAQQEDHYNVITAHQLILHDEHLVDETIRHITDGQINAEWAIRKTVTHIKGVLDAVEDDYFRERRSDVEFVGERILRNLLGHETVVSPPPDAIVVARDLSPADTAQVYRAMVAGIITDVGGKTSHTAIMARAHEVPCVVGLEDITNTVQNGDLLIVDGTEGVVILQPTPAVVADYRERRRMEAAADAALVLNCGEPAVTTDGQEVILRSNIEATDEIPGAISHGAKGIGLFRTEYLYMGTNEMPTEENLYQLATNVLAELGGEPATFRTMDVGADKLSRLVTTPHAEANPALGLRSLRLCLTNAVLPLFKQQIRAFLRASVNGPIRLMLPMISGVSELKEALGVIDDCRDELTKAGVAIGEKMPIGIMIETPSAALVADHLGALVDFFSIGTNDLIQYTMAVDRVNEFVSYLYEPMHPAILRLIGYTMSAAKKNDISVSVCGEMAGDAEVAPLLVGLGLRELSMHSVAIPGVKNAIRKHSLVSLEKLAQDAIVMPDGEAVQNLVRSL